MKDSQDFKVKLKPVTTVQQLISSYYVAEAIAKIRKQRDESIKDKIRENLPFPQITDKALLSLYNNFSELINYKLGFLLIAKLALEDMERYNFKEDASVASKQKQDTKHLQKQFGQSFASLSNISLSDHTKRVFKNGLSLGKQKGRAMQIALPILGCLLHDFGKSTAIRKEILGGATSAYTPHAEVSAMYIKEILFQRAEKEFPGQIHSSTIEVLSEAVENHHPSTNKFKSNEIVKFISNADNAARREEIRILQKATK